MVGKINRTKIKKKLDKLVKDYVKKRDGYTCQHCGKICYGSDCHASHILNVGSHSHLEFEPRNMKVLCMRCHIYFWHKDVMLAHDWYATTFPENWAYLQELDKSKTKTSTAELQELIKHYQNLLDNDKH